MHFFKKLSILILSFLVFTQQTYATVALTPQERTENISFDIRNSDTPSDLPIASYDDFFDTTIENLIFNMDLSQYNGLRGFIGYGLYDKNQDICQFLELPTETAASFDYVFEKYGKTNQHTYGLTRNEMNYTSCEAIASRFGGTPVIIDSASENFYIRNTFTKSDTGTEFPVWLGLTINSCTDTYLAANNRTQSFFNWSSSPVNEGCSTSQKNVILTPEYAKWLKKNGTLLYKCVVEWDSEEIYKPLKVCAPWWRIERTYKNYNFTGWNQQMLDRINQSLIPTTLNICTRYDQTAASEAYNSPSRNFTCTSYYSATAALECSRNIKQPQCFVDECQGYVKDVCQLISTDVVGKGYVKGNINSQGQNTTTKIKDEIETHLYSCPPSPPAKEDCLESSKVMIWPKECQNSQCEALKECVYTAESNDAANDCYDQYTCESIYPDRLIPPLTDSSGNVIELYGRCSDGTLLSFVPNILEKKNKVCIEYDEYNVTKSVVQQCKDQRTDNDIIVNVAFSDNDDYENNPNCIRTDTIENSQQRTDVTLNINMKGWFNNRISQVFLNDETSTIKDTGGDDFFLYTVVADLSFVYDSFSTPESNTTTCDIDLQCGILDNEVKYNQFNDRTLAVLTTGNQQTQNVLIPFLDMNTHSFTIPNLTSSECDNYAFNNGFSAYLVNKVFTRNILTVRGTCDLTVSSVELDNEFSKVSIFEDPSTVNTDGQVNSGFKYTFKNQMTKEECLKKAVCLGGKFEANNFGNSYSSVGECVVIETQESIQPYIDYLMEKEGCETQDIDMTPPDDQYCKPGEAFTSAFSTIDGFSSILIIEDYLNGPWSYYSNFTTQLPEQNYILVSTESIQDKEVYPLIDIPTVLDTAQYYISIYHEAWLAKNPDYAAGAAVIAASAAATYGAVQASLIALSVPVVGVIIAVVIIIVLLVMNRPKRMNRQDQAWVIYKHISPDNFQHSLYEKRKLVTEKIGFENGQITINDGPPVKINNSDWIYTFDQVHTGRREPGDFKTQLDIGYKRKRDSMLCMGYFQGQIDLATHPSERNIITGYPSRSRWNPWAEKMNSYNWIMTKDISKSVNTVYFGADQSLGILLPYIGNFNIKAYDRFDNLLGQVEITKDSFVNVFNANALAFAKVQFGNSMSIAPNVSESAACVADDMVEWGGGVSGGYFESKTTGSYNNCAKSNDDYVKQHSMVKIVISPSNLEGDEFEFVLKKPLPFANRIFAMTLGKNQTRHYKCFNDFNGCQSDDEFQDMEN